MVPMSLAQLFLAMIDRGRAELVDRAGALYGRALLGLSARTLRWLERHGVDGAGWALVAIELERAQRTQGQGHG